MGPHNQVCPCDQVFLERVFRNLWENHLYQNTDFHDPISDTMHIGKEVQIIKINNERQVYEF